MLNGPLAGKIVRFAIPLAAASILQQLFNSADLAVIGRFENSTAMAAVGSNAAIVGLLVSLFGGLSLGTNVVVATLIGQGRKERIGDAVHTSISLAFLSGIVIWLLGLVLAPAILRAISTPDEVLPLASLYLRIYFGAMPFMLVYDFGSSVLRAKGDSGRPLRVLIISGILNVVLNLFFVGVCRLSVAGVAIATVISNILSAALVLNFLMHEEEAFRFSFRKLRISGQEARRIVAIGAPAGLQGMVFNISNVVVQSGINSFGADCIAGNTAGQNFEYMAYFVIFAFAQTATTFTSQNFAAGKMDRCHKVYVLTAAFGLSATFALSMSFYGFRHILIQIFTTDPEVIVYAFARFRYIGNFELLTGIYEIPGGCLRGRGHSMIPMVITMIGSCAFRLIWIATFFQSHHTIENLLIIYPISWVLSGIAMNIALAIDVRKVYAQLHH
jgi:putative MATE family efflux protein